jgi:hypothetical protein
MINRCWPTNIESNLSPRTDNALLAVLILLLSYVKHHKNVTKDTISRWIKVILNRSRINTKIFGSHSVRSASTSKAKSNAVPIDEILKKAGWSNVKTFATFYDKKIAKDGFAERGTEAVIIVSLIITSQQPENCENRNDLDLVQAFLKKWRVESDFKAPNLPL